MNPSKIYGFLVCSLVVLLEYAASEHCNDYCKKTFPLHTYPKEKSYYACIRGCRLGRINQLSHELSDKDEVVDSCKKDCTNAYTDKEGNNACIIGCKQQDMLPTPAGLLQVELEKANLQVPVIHHFVLQPVRVVRHYCAGMLDSVVTFVAMRTAVIVKEDGWESMIIQVNDAPYVHVQNGIAKNKHQGSQLGKEDHPMRRMSYYGNWYDHGSRWIDCVAAKAHLPPWLLALALLLCFLTAIWLCCTMFLGSDSSDDKKYAFERVITAESVDAQKYPLFTIENYEAAPLPQKVKLTDLA